MTLYMAHPFTLMFEKALKNSHGDENLVLGEAEMLLEKGYAAKEIYDVLITLQKSLVDDTEREVLDEAIEEFSQYIEGE